MVELAEGFGIDDDGEFIEGVICPDGCEYEFEDIMKLDIIFPLLIHRAVEGWNLHSKEYEQINIFKCGVGIFNRPSGNKEYAFKNYSPSSLTHAECAMLHCLQEVLK